MVRLLLFITACIAKSTGHIDIPWWIIIGVFIFLIIDLRKLIDK